MYTYQEVLSMVKEGMAELTEAKYPEELLNEWAQGCVSIYTAEIQSEWVSLDFADQNRWRDHFALSDLGEDKDIEYLMTIDLCVYYEGLFDQAYREVQEELEASE